MSRHRLFLDSPTQVGKNRITLPKALADYYGNTAQAYVNGRQVDSTHKTNTAYFSGNGSGVEFPSFDFINLSHDFSIECKINADAFQMYDRIWSLRNDIYLELRTYQTGDTSVLNLRTGINRLTTIALNKEINYTLTFVYKANIQKMYLYANGENIYESTIDSFSSDTLRNTIGYVHSYTDYRFSGNIWDFRVWDKALSTNEIGGNIDGSEPNLKMWLPLIEDATDYSGNGNNGTASNLMYENTGYESTSFLTFTTPTPVREIEIGRGNLELTDTSGANEVGVLHWTPSSESGYYWVLVNGVRKLALNIGGQVHYVEKVFLNEGGILKQCNVLMNEGGVVRYVLSN